MNSFTSVAVSLIVIVGVVLAVSPAPPVSCQLCLVRTDRPIRVQPSIPCTESCARLANEVFLNPGPSCQITCQNLFHCCNIRNIMAERNCYCLPGYARSRIGDCIPIASTQCLREARVRDLLSSVPGL